jgi:hypothetical protein
VRILIFRGRAGTARATRRLSEPPASQQKRSDSGCWTREQGRSYADSGETALHWAALLGEDRLAGRLIEDTDVDLKDENHDSPLLVWSENPKSTAFLPPMSGIATLGALR